MFFCHHFEELQTKLFEVELIINNAPLIYVYPNTIKTCLTPNYLLLGRQLLLSSNATSTVAANLTVLSCTTDKINRISNHFGIRGDMIKTKYKKMEKYPDTFGELPLTGVLHSRDSEIRAAIV